MRRLWWLLLGWAVWVFAPPLQVPELPGRRAYVSPETPLVFHLVDEDGTLLDRVVWPSRSDVAYMDEIGVRW